jgi:hypothetical protein
MVKLLIYEVLFLLLGVKNRSVLEQIEIDHRHEEIA